VRKAVSRFNALKSGIHARAYRIGGEDAASLAALVRDDDLQKQPADPLERFAGLWGWNSWLPFSPSRPAPPHQPMLTTSG
jgi:hypothetical protein